MFRKSPADSLSREEKFKDAAFDLAKRKDDDIDVINQPDLTEIQQNWTPIGFIEKVGHFEIYTPTADIYKWRLKDATGEELLTSNADYITDVTCKNGINSAEKSILSTGEPNPFIIGVSDNKYSFVLKAGNGKIIGVGPMYDNEHAAEADIEIIKKIIAES